MGFTVQAGSEVHKAYIAAHYLSLDLKHEAQPSQYLHAQQNTYTDGPKIRVILLLFKHKNSRRPSTAKYCTHERRGSQDDIDT